MKKKKAETVDAKFESTQAVVEEEKASRLNTDKSSEQSIKGKAKSGKSGKEQEQEESEKKTSSPQEISEKEIRQDLESKIHLLENTLEKTEHVKGELEERLLRLQAEFDNYRKRTTREKEELTLKAQCQTSKAWLPLIDNLERACYAFEQYFEQSEKSENPLLKSVHEGMEMIQKQAEKVLKDLEIEEVPGLGTCFDPSLHTAIMHEEEEGRSEQEIVQVFEKGYQCKGELLRPGVVKVVN